MNQSEKTIMNVRQFVEKLESCAGIEVFIRQSKTTRFDEFLEASRTYVLWEVKDSAIALYDPDTRKIAFWQYGWKKGVEKIVQRGDTIGLKRVEPEGDSPSTFEFLFYTKKQVMSKEEMDTQFKTAMAEREAEKRRREEENMRQYQERRRLEEEAFLEKLNASPVVRAFIERTKQPGTNWQIVGTKLGFDRIPMKEFEHEAHDCRIARVYTTKRGKRIVGHHVELEENGIEWRIDYSRYAIAVNCTVTFKIKNAQAV